MTLNYEPTLADVIREAMEFRLLDVHVSFPARVVSFDPETETVDVQCNISKVFFDREGEKVVEKLPLLQNVPVAFPRGKMHSITFPLSEGDQVMIVFADRNIGQWQETGEDGDPGDLTSHGLSGAWAIPGGYPSAKATGQAVSGKMVLSGEVLIGDKSAAQRVVLGDSLKDWLAAHTHGTGTGPTTSPIQAATLGQTLSTRHKVDE